MAVEVLRADPDRPDDADSEVGPQPTMEQDTNVEQRRPTLRLAVAMRGGVSLAVWTGGALAELDVLRRAMSTQAGMLAPTVPSTPDPPRDARKAAPWARRKTAPWARREAAAKARREELREERRSIYRDLLDLADLDHVEIDVLAGASAGGLNAVLYGTALANGQRIDDMREVWADLAEIPPLLRQTAKWPGRFVPSPLRGDEYFYLALRDRLRRLATPPPHVDGPWFDDPDAPKPAAAYLTIALSATMLPKTDQHGIREQRERGADSGRASFSFSLRPTTAGRSMLSDLPVGRRRDEAWQTFLIDRLALAGRSTSSFPGAFEPARIYADPDNWAKIGYHPPRPTGQAGGPSDPPPAEDPMSRYRREPLVAMPDMVDVFSAVRDPLGARQSFGVIDGGVFDNIAIGRALAAIAYAPAEVHTRRWLIYLDPDPAKPPVPRSGSLRPAAFTVPRLILSLVGMRAASSTVHDDLEALQQHNERVQARRATTDAFSHQLLDQVSAVAAANTTQPARTLALRTFGRQLARPDGESMREYGRYRAAIDLPRLTQLLVRPQQTISGQIVRKKGHHPWSEESVGEVMLQLRKPLHAWYTEQGTQLHLDLTAVMQTAEFLITWTRALDAWHYENRVAYAQDTSSGGAGERKRLKRVLYRVLFLATALRDLADQTMLADSSADRLDDRVVAALTKARDTQPTYHLSSRLHEYFNVTPDPQHLLTPPLSDEMFYDAAADYLCGDLTDPDHGKPGPREVAVQQPANLYLWTRLTEMFTLVRNLSTDVQDQAERATGGSDRPWQYSPFRLLTQYPELVQPLPPLDGPDPALADLGPIFAGAGGLPDNTQMVAFDTFTADQFSPLYQQMTRLGQAVAADWARQMSGGRMPDTRRPWLDSRTKLAGNQLANFAGFLDRRWRSNDWMWGRADSAANLVSLLVRHINPRHLAPDGKPEVAQAANSLARHVGWPQRPTWTMSEIRELCDEVTRRLQLSIVEELLSTAFGDDSRRRFRRRVPERDLADLTTGQETPAVLRPSRRSGLIVHGGLLLFRAMLPSTTGPRTFVIKATAQLGRPLLALLLLPAMPARAVLLLGLVLAGAAVSGFGGSGNGVLRAGVLGAIAAAGCAVFALRATAARRRLRNATQAGPDQDRPHPPGLTIDSGQQAISGPVTAATVSARELAATALDILRRVYRRRRAVAVAMPTIFVILAVTATLAWNRVGPWLARGNTASAGGFALAELLVILLLWRMTERPFRARTGTRPPTQPWLIWILAIAAVLAASAAGHLTRVAELINNPVGSAGQPDGQAAWIAIAGGGALLCAMVLVSTFDWMRLSWLPVAWLLSLAIYGGLVLLFDRIGVTNRPIEDVGFAAFAYGLSFSYFITAFCASRYPGRRSKLPEP